MKSRLARVRQRLWGADGASLLVFISVFALLAALVPAQGLTDDDDYYAPAGISYVSWAAELLRAPGAALQQSAIDRAFSPNHEHPPFAKWVIGAAHALFHRGLGSFGALDAARLGVAAFLALLCAVLVRMAWRPFGPGLACFSALALLAMPRVLFHGQVATLDIPVACMVVCTTAAFLWAERSRTWVWLCGGLFGLALSTKLNAPFAALPALLYTLLCRWRGFALDARRGLTLPPLPGALWTMALVGPLVFLALWPWLWFDTAHRFAAYVAFHLKHYPIYLLYEGEIFTKPFAPWHMPFRMAAGVIPLPLLVLGGVGTASALRALWRVVRHSDGRGELRRVSLRDKVLALVLLQTLFAIGIVAFSHVPKYGGEKLFMPFFPLFALLTTEGLRLLGVALVHVRPAWASCRRVRVGSLALLAALALWPGVRAAVVLHGGFGLSYYAESLGGLRGATARGMERTYYDIADKELATWLDAHVAPGERVHFEPNHKEYARTYRWLRNDGVISQKVQLEARRERAQVWVLTHERRWSTYPALLAEHRAHDVIYEKRVEGVPLYTVYRRR